MEHLPTAEQIDRALHAELRVDPGHAQLLADHFSHLGDASQGILLAGALVVFVTVLGDVRRGAPVALLLVGANFTTSSLSPLASPPLP